MKANQPPPMNPVTRNKSTRRIEWRWLITCLLAVISGLGIYLFIFLFSAPCSSGKLSQVDADMRSIDSALASYKVTSGSFPTTEHGLKALVEKPSAASVPHRWSPIMKKLPCDPWGSHYDYRFPGRMDGSKPEIISRGSDGVANTADDLSSQDE
jgi:general secretion pathway protein G